MGAVQPLDAMASSQILLSGVGKWALRPPQTASDSGMGVRMEGGQLASSQLRVCVRNVSISVIGPPRAWMHLLWMLRDLVERRQSDDQPKKRDLVAAIFVG